MHHIDDGVHEELGEDERPGDVSHAKPHERIADEEVAKLEQVCRHEAEREAEEAAEQREERNMVRARARARSLHETWVDA